MAIDMELRAAADIITPMTVRIAVTLRIADHIEAGHTTAGELAAKTGTDSATLERILRHLARAGVLTWEDDGYGLTDLGRRLRFENAEKPPTWLDINTACGRAELAVVRLLDTLTTSQTAYQAYFGTTFWQDMFDDRALAGTFDSLMSGLMATESTAVANAYDWGALDEIVDVGGGNGTLLVTLLTAYPTLRGTVLDRTAEPAQETIDKAGLADRAGAIAGSFLEPLPRGAGGYILSRIQSDWNDADARTILGRCAEAAGPDGKVLVVDEFLDEDPKLRDTYTDMQMLTYFGGKERTLSEVLELAEDAGLTRTSLIPAGHFTIIEFAVGRPTV